MVFGVALVSFLSFFQAGDLVADVRALIARNDYSSAEKQLEQRRKSPGITPQWLEAYSWLGRGALASKRLEAADKYAKETYRLAVAETSKRPLDKEPQLPIALGASIEVQGLVLAAKGDRAGAVAYLESELERWRSTSIRTRIQKNINLLSLEGKPAPELDVAKFIGTKPKQLSAWKGRPVLMFFWAHWCADCKEQGPILTRVMEKYAPQGLVLIAPTQPYGYVAGGEEAPPVKEVAYIDSVFKQHYALLKPAGVPVSEENFKRYGASSTPTLVLVDRSGIVRAYHPGRMTYEELNDKLAALLK